MLKEYTHNYFLTAGECNAQGLMPVSLLTERIIEVASEHANALGIGYSALQPKGIGWVLSRVSIVMERWPQINSEYSLTTWIEGWTRLYSDRCFVVKDQNGNVFGYARTVWVAIDIHNRCATSLDQIADPDMVNTQMECPIPKQRKMLPVDIDTATSVRNYTFGYADLDFNRHVNSTRYIDHILDTWSLQFYDKFTPMTFEIAYAHECLYGQKVTIAAQQDNGTASVDMIRDNVRVITARILFKDNEKSSTGQ